MTFSAGKCSVRKNPSTALHENAPSKPLTAYATNPDHYTVIPTTLLKAHHAFRHTNPSKTALSLENCQHTCHMNALFVLRPAKLRAFNFGHPCPSLVKGEVLSPEKNSGDYRRDCSAIFHSEPTLPKPHYPSKIANTLATLVKGRWIDGKAQTVALLLSACDMPTLFILQTFLPSRRRDCLPLHRILPFPQSSQKYNHPLLRTTFFHPLSKVRCCPTNSTIGSL